MSTPFEISDRLTEKWADLAPINATLYGISGRDHLYGDLSPKVHSGLETLFRRTRDEMAPHLDDPDAAQAFAARVTIDYLDERIRELDSKQWRRDLNHIASPFQNIRDVFDVMPRVTPEDWENIVARLRGYPALLEGYQESLALGIDAGDTVAARQVRSVIEQAEAAASDDSRFSAFPAQAAKAGAEADVVEEAVDVARGACARFARWLREIYLPTAREEDPVGREEYLRGVDRWLGVDLDLEETYQWGWSEVHRIRVEMNATAKEIDPDMTIAEVIDLLETDPARSAGTRDEFVEFVSKLQQEAIGQLAGDHFDVPDELKTVTVNIAPPGGSLGAWYQSPSEDFSRPGSIWYAPGERERLPYWQEVTTAYHEGFPGHHLQVGTEVLQRETLSRFHRNVIFYSGTAEGWALYAERLMDELGFFEKPEYRLGLLASQLFRSVRVVVDIGCHLEFRIPEDAPLHAGEVWDYDKAVDYMEQVGLQARDIAESEVTRYLGWWGQAISYKVGEREILRIRDSARTADDFDLKDFHRKVLEIGTVRLDLLREMMT